MNYDAISAIINTATVELGDPRKLNDTELTMIVPPQLLRAACRHVGLKLESYMGARVSRFPRIHIQLTPDLSRNLLNRGVYGLEEKDSIGRGKGCGNTYYLQVLDCNRLTVNYQQIIGGWTVGELTDIQSALLMTRIADGIKAQGQMEEAT